ncbi:MAG: hypothetical protein ACTHKU_06145 [Verrucomicrobiota bacterium]
MEWRGTSRIKSKIRSITHQPPQNFVCSRQAGNYPIPLGMSRENSKNRKSNGSALGFEATVWNTADKLRYIAIPKIP